MWSHLTWFRISMTALQVKSPLMTNVDTILQIMWFQKIQSTIWQNQETGEHWWWNLLKSFLWMLDIDDKDRRSRWENLFAIERTDRLMSLSLWERDEALTNHKTRHFYEEAFCRYELHFDNIWHHKPNCKTQIMIFVRSLDSMFVRKSF